MAENKRTGEGLLRALALFGVLFALFPFAVMLEGIGLGRYVFWEYVVLMAVFAAFGGIGYLLGAWSEGGSFSKTIKPLVNFAARAAVVLPAVAFIIVCVVTKLSTAMYIYAFPAAIVAYYGGLRCFGRSYSEVFTRGWFAAYLIMAIFASVLLWFTHDDALIASGGFQLCAGFGVIIVLSAVLANQTNVDTRTHQRSGGRAVLPSGLRAYNARLSAGICVAITALFLFTKPVALLLGNGIKALVALLLDLIQRGGELEQGTPIEFPENGEDALDASGGSNVIFRFFEFLLGVAFVLLIIRFHKPIFAFFRELFAPLFKDRAPHDDIPFIDEISSCDDKKSSASSRSALMRTLRRKYSRESDPTAKYRTGYALFMLKLGETPFPTTPSDTTSIHAQKGGMAFRSEDIAAMTLMYNEVRYGGKIPPKDEIEKQELLLKRIL